MRPGLLALLLALTGLGCRTGESARAKGESAQPTALGVEGVELKFLDSGKADLAFTLVTPPETKLRQSNEVQWELWLDGRYFAAGVWRADVALPQGQTSRIKVSSPLVFRPGPVKNELMAHSVGVKGYLVGSTGVGTARVAFAEQQVLWLAGTPAWDKP